MAVYIIYFLILLACWLLYMRYVDIQSQINPNVMSYAGIKKYLLNNDTSLAHVTKPIMWIHVPFEKNARHWESIGSRSSMELNQPYLYLTVQSIINHCDRDFHICIIDDASFFKLLPNWTINLDITSGQMQTNIRRLGMTKLLHEYGGIIVPISFLCFRPLIELFNFGTSGDRVFVCENSNRNVTSVVENFGPSIEFMGVREKNNKIIDRLCNYMTRIISTDFTSESKFVGDFDRWVRGQTNIRIIMGTDVGTRTLDNKAIIIDTLMEERPLKIFKDGYGIWIPMGDFLSRRQYGWFVRQSTEQVLNGRSILSKMILVAIGETTLKQIMTEHHDKPNWINYWRVPSLAPVFGMKPLGLGYVANADE